MKIGQYEDENAFLNACLIRAADQRISDINKSQKGRPHVTFRGQSDMCLAYSIIDHNFYIGYSAIAGGIVGNHDHYINRKDPDQPSRRFERIRSLVHVSAPLDNGVINRPVVNCAEACALSIAVSWGQEIQNLVFVTYYPCNGRFARVTQDGYPIQKDPAAIALAGLEMRVDMLVGARFLCARTNEKMQKWGRIYFLSKREITRHLSPLSILRGSSVERGSNCFLHCA